MKTLRPEHLKSCLEAADARGVLPMFYLELVSGLRKGELVVKLHEKILKDAGLEHIRFHDLRHPNGYC